MQSIINDDVHHVKKGWLMKCAKDSGKNWRKRYFILTHNTLNYYLSDKDLRKPKGNVLIVGDGQVRNENAIATKSGKENNKKFFGFRFTTPFESILFLSATEKDRALWVKSIQYAIDHAHLSLRGYMLKRTSAMSMLDPTVRKFWVLHKDILSYHKDHENTKIDEWSYLITDDVEIEPDDHKWKLKLNTGKGERIITIQFEERTKGEYPLWRDALLDIRNRHEREEAAYHKRVEAAIEASVHKSSNLKVKTQSGVAKEASVAISKTEVVLQETSEDGESHATFFPLSQTSTIRAVPVDEGGSESGLTFQITTASETIQLTATTEEEVQQWTEAIQQVCPEQPQAASGEDILRRACIKKLADSVYETTIVEKKALGIVFQPVNDWAVVKQYAGYDSTVTGVTPGSSLMAVNGNTVTLAAFHDATNLLSTGFQAPEPLVLQFRRAPYKQGNLSKKSATKRGGAARAAQWTDRAFLLDCGTLVIYPTENEAGAEPIRVPLKGAEVQLCQFSEYLKEYAFRVNVGSVSMILQAGSAEEALDWAASIHTAAAIASGGGFIINEEIENAGKQEAFNNTLYDMPAEMSEEAQACVIAIGQAIENCDSASLEPALQSAYANPELLEGAMAFLEVAGARLNEIYERDHYEANDFAAYNMLCRPDEQQQEIIDEQSFLTSAMDLMGGEQGDSDDDDSDRPRSSRPKQAQSSDYRGSISATLAMEMEEFDEESQYEDSMAELAHLKELEKLAEPDPEEVGVCANEEDLVNIFGFYKKKDESGGDDFVSVMNFCTIWRMVTGEKGNLMREMQVFNKFDLDKNGVLEVDDFVTGFLNHSVENHTNKLLIKLHSLVEGGSHML